MIRSEFTGFQLFGQFLSSGLLIVLGYVFYLGFWGVHPVHVLSGLGVFVIFITVGMPLFIIAQMKQNYKTVIIDTEENTISFKMFILPISSTYRFSDFEGFAETKVTDKYGEYKRFYLVKNGLLKYSICGRYYSNIDELEDGLSSLKKLGFFKYSGRASFKILFNKPVELCSDEKVLS